LKNNTKSQDKMTPERLRKYLFDGPSVPFWDYDPEKITVGIEIEYFIGSGDEKDYCLATKEQFCKFTKYLEKNSGYEDKNLVGQPGRISKNTELGFIAIKPDFAWHILEIALPPRKTNEEIRKLLIEVFQEVDDALSVQGLKRLDMSCLREVPERMDIVEHVENVGYLEASEQVKSDSLLYSSVFPALITSTQIHLNVLEEGIFEILPGLYKADQEAQNKFCRKQKFLNFSGHDIRQKLWEEGLGADYSLRTTPPIIPETIEKYCHFYNSSTILFPRNKFFGVKDLSYIRPTQHGTVEFRSACSQVEILKIIDIVEFWRFSFIEVFEGNDTSTRKLGGV
jgi:hypothetical protein